MLLDLLKNYKAGKLSTSQALAKIQSIKYNEYYISIDNQVNFDINREATTQIPEVIFAQNKTKEEMKKIFFSLKKKKILVTKINIQKKNALKESWLKKYPLFPFTYNERANVLYTPSAKKKKENILILSGGTSDLNIVEEIKCSLDFFGLDILVYNDVGVASLTRLLHLTNKIRKAKVIIIVAGMEATLPSVVAGLSSAPIIAVPTSVGYYGHFKGLTALLSMLGSCSPGIGVVNIDNGFGAAALVKKMIKKMQENKQGK